jgi:hypothetical protein
MTGRLASRAAAWMSRMNCTAGIIADLDANSIETAGG